ncbi:3371_t:CDS:1, partial [Diversispora eburnea]
QQCYFNWKGINIDTDIKSFVKKKDEIESLTTWFTQHRINKWLNKKIIEETNWKWSIQSWHGSKITSTKTNTKESILRSFSLKLLNEELPTMATLHTRKPEVYTKPECPFCNKYKETNTHVFLCSEKGKKLKIAFRATVKEIYVKEKGNKGVEELMIKIT